MAHLILRAMPLHTQFRVLPRLASRFPDRWRSLLSSADALTAELLVSSWQPATMSSQAGPVNFPSCQAGPVDPRRTRRGKDGSAGGGNQDGMREEEEDEEDEEDDDEEDEDDEEEEEDESEEDDEDDVADDENDGGEGARRRDRHVAIPATLPDFLTAIFQPLGEAGSEVQTLLVSKQDDLRELVAQTLCGDVQLWCSS